MNHIGRQNIQLLMMIKLISLHIHILLEFAQTVEPENIRKNTNTTTLPTPKKTSNLSDHYHSLYSTPPPFNKKLSPSPHPV